MFAQKEAQGYLLNISSSPKRKEKGLKGKKQAVQSIHCPEKRKNSNTETGDRNINVQNKSKRIIMQPNQNLLTVSSSPKQNLLTVHISSVSFYQNRAVYTWIESKMAQGLRSLIMADPNSASMRRNKMQCMHVSVLY